MRNKRAAFSLVELVIVIVIMGVIAAIAVPRISRGAAGAGGAALRADLYILRNAIDMYAAEHDGTYPAVATFENQMTLYSSSANLTSATKDTTFKYGPYMVAIPNCKVGDGKGENGVAALPGATIGWIYLEIPGNINASAGLTAKDDDNVLYKDY